MNKRGQVYLVAAIIVCMIAILLISRPNFLREQVLLQNFKDISNNYLTESPKVVNNALEENAISADCQIKPNPKLCDIKEDLSGFTTEFVNKYARNQDPNVGLIYIYTDQNGIILQNYLNDESVRFESGQGETVLVSEDEKTCGQIGFQGIGASSEACANLCVDVGPNYCILSKDNLPNGPINLKIGDINYKFEINEESPELIVIVKSKEGETVKVDVTENKL